MFYIKTKRDSNYHLVTMAITWSQVWVQCLRKFIARKIILYNAVGCKRGVLEDFFLIDYGYPRTNYKIKINIDQQNECNVV